MSKRKNDDRNRRRKIKRELDKVRKKQRQRLHNNLVTGVVDKLLDPLEFITLNTADVCSLTWAVDDTNDAWMSKLIEAGEGTLHNDKRYNVVISISNDDRGALFSLYFNNGDEDAIPISSCAVGCSGGGEQAWINLVDRYCTNFGIFDLSVEDRTELADSMPELPRDKPWLAACLWGTVSPDWLAVFEYCLARTILKHCFGEHAEHNPNLN